MDEPTSYHPYGTAPGQPIDPAGNPGSVMSEGLEGGRSPYSPVGQFSAVDPLKDGPFHFETVRAILRRTLEELEEFLKETDSDSGKSPLEQLQAKLMKAKKRRAYLHMQGKLGSKARVLSALGGIASGFATNLTKLAELAILGVELSSCKIRWSDYLKKIKPPKSNPRAYRNWESLSRMAAAGEA